MYPLNGSDVELFRTDTLLVWIRRPDSHHQNWWLCYYSTNEDEAQAWDWAIKVVGRQLELQPFHQGCWAYDHPQRHPKCGKLSGQQHDCPGVAQAWEMWLGCSERGLRLHDEPLDEIVAWGDSALERVLTAAPLIREKVAQW